MACAWVLSGGDDIVPLLGTRNRQQLRDSLDALGLSRSPGDLEDIERAVSVSAVVGGRNDDCGMLSLDSERSRVL